MTDSQDNERDRAPLAAEFARLQAEQERLHTLTAEELQRHIDAVVDYYARFEQLTRPR